MKSSPQTSIPSDGCTDWLQVWLGMDLRPCCADHDAAGLGLVSNMMLGLCVAARAFAHYGPAHWPWAVPAAALMGFVMWLGTSVLGRPWLWLKRAFRRFAGKGRDAG